MTYITTRYELEVLGVVDESELSRMGGYYKTNTPSQAGPHDCTCEGSTNKPPFESIEEVESAND